LKELSSTTGLKRSRLRGAFIVGQLAVSAVLLIMASLLVRSLSSPQSADRGFVSENVFMASVSPGNAGYTKERGVDFFERLLQRLEATPGVVSANVAEVIPLTLSSATGRYQTDGAEPLSVNQNTISRGHFRTLGIPILAGRDFNVADRDGAPAVGIVNERLAQRLWPNESPVGKRLRSGKGPWIEVVGMVRDSKYVGISETPKLFLYRPIGQMYDPRAHQSLLIKTTSNPMTMLTVVRTAVDELDPAMPIFGASSLDETTQISLLPAKIAATFAGALGILAVLLAVIGIYGVVSYLARHRTREIGIRIALGARPSQVMWFVSAEVLRWTIFGLVLGLGVSLGIAQFAKDFLYGVSPADPVSFGGIALILTATAYAACWIPARRATRVDPTVALREE
jgi:predicted permease